MENKRVLLHAAWQKVFDETFPVAVQNSEILDGRLDDQVDDLLMTASWMRIFYTRQKVL